MIDLDVAEFSLGIAESAGSESVSVKCAMVHEFITRLRQAEKDAARYRWLKEQKWFADEAEWFMPLNTDEDNYEFSGSFDSAIDEAMNGSNN